MAQRFIIGFIVSKRKLKELVGSQKPVSLILKGRTEEEEDINAQFEDDELNITVKDLLEEILNGKLKKSNRYGYSRIVELILKSVGHKLGEIDMVETYYLPNDSFGRWNPILKKIGLSVLSEIWATPNLHFPWFKPGMLADFPSITEISPSILTKLELELRGPWKDNLAKLSSNILSEEEDNIEDTKEELIDGLKIFEKWIKKTLMPGKEKVCVDIEGNSLVLIMDGDQ